MKTPPSAVAHRREDAGIWLWPNLLSLDAPAVAISWQVLLAHELGVRVPASVTLALALAVWAIYVVDRVLDGPRCASPRHRFASRHGSFLLKAVGFLAVAAVCVLLPNMPPRTIAHGMALAALCFTYLVTVQYLPGWRHLKSVAMALLFSAGVTLPFWSSVAIPAFFGTACVVWTNAALIDRWEAQVSTGLWLRIFLFAGGGVLLALGGRYFEALALGSWFMLALDVAAERFRLYALRYLVDGVLALAAWIGFQ